MTTISQPAGYSMFCANEKPAADADTKKFVAELGDSTTKAAALTKWDVIDSDSGEFFGRELSHAEAKALAKQLGSWARVVFHPQKSAHDGEVR